MVRYAVIVTTLFFIANFLILLDDIFVGSILPNFSLSEFLNEFVYMIGAFINSFLNVLTGVIRLELRLVGFLTVIGKLFLWLGGSFTTIIGDFFALPFTLLSGIFGLGRVNVVNICNVNVINQCAVYYDGRMSTLNNGTVDGTNFNKFAFWFIIDFRYGSFEIGIYNQIYNFIDINVIQNDRFFFVIGFSLAGDNPNLLGGSVKALTLKIDLQLVINLPADLRKFEILNGLNEFFNNWSDDLGSWEDIFYKTVGDDF